MGVILVEGPQVSGRVSPPGPLHLYHIGAVVGQELGAVGTGDVVGKVQNPYTFQGLIKHVYCPQNAASWNAGASGWGRAYRRSANAGAGKRCWIYALR